MELKQAIYGRRAVREYTTAAVDESTIRQIIDAAIQAPSAVNQQPWLFTVMRDGPLMSRISDESKAYMLRTSQAALASPHLQTILSDPNFNIFYHAPALIVISAPAGPWAVEDCALAAENLMLAAHAAGLGTCWIGFAQGWLATNAGKAALKLFGEETPVAPIIVGYPKSNPPAVTRKPARIDWVSG
jgi:nitroreductase